MTPDSALLQRYASQGDQVAFREWVELRLGFVYAVALRVLNGDVHLAQDAAQQVFTDAARRARELADHPALSAWLFTSSRFAAAKLVRSQQRRRQREQAVAMIPPSEDHPVDWPSVRPVLDEALASLPPPDRDAILQRYFAQADYAAIARQLDLSQDAARMRVDRALEKLSRQLRRRGVTSTAAALGSALASHAVPTLPSGLASSVSAAALGAASLLTPATMITALKFPLLATAVVAVTGAVLISQELVPPEDSRATQILVPPPVATSSPTSAGTPAAAVVEADFAALEQEVTHLQARLAALDHAAVARLARPAVTGKILPARDLDTPPHPSKQVPPTYPADLRRAGITGRADIAMTIDDTGAVRGLETISTTHEDFAAAALEAVAQWQFTPGQKDGLPVKTRIQVPIVFNIANPSSTPDDWF